MPVTLLVLLEKKAISNTRHIKEKLAALALWVVSSAGIIIMHWMPLSRYFVLTYVPLILLVSFGFAGLMRSLHAVKDNFSILLAAFLLVTPSFFTLASGTAWYEKQGNELCLSSPGQDIRKNDAYLVQTVKSFILDRTGTLIVAKAVEADLLMFTYQNAYVVSAIDFGDGASDYFSTYREVYFLEYNCNRSIVTGVREGKPRYENNAYCESLRQLSKKLILKTKDPENKDLEIHLIKSAQNATSYKGPPGNITQYCDNADKPPPGVK